MRLLFFQVKGVFIDKRAASAPANILPKSKPILHQLRGKDPVELENCGYVSIWFRYLNIYFCICYADTAFKHLSLLGSA